MIRKSLAALIVAALVALGGCSASPAGGGQSSPVPVPVPATATPAQGRSLAQLGLTEGPSDLIWLPDQVLVTYQAQQPNLLIVSGGIAQADLVEDYLRSTLPALGWRITADAPGGLLFEQGAWHGGFAAGDQDWALTVRDDEG